MPRGVRVLASVLMNPLRSACRVEASALRAVTALLAAGSVALLATPAAAAPAASGQPETPPQQSAASTSTCPYWLTPPPAVDASELPAPGLPAPEPLPLPEEPVGGERMGECGLVLPEGAPPPPADITAASWVLADLHSGAVLAAKDPHARHRPASTIKLLTALVVVERLPLDQVVIGTQADADQIGSGVGVGPDGRYTVAELLAGLLLRSGNDAAFALARALGGLPETLRAMQQRAEQLGALDTRPATPSGLDGPGMSSSAYDLAVIFRAALAQPPLAQLMRIPQVAFPGFRDKPGFLVSNDNQLLANYPGALGGKTGFTDDARHTYVGAAQRDGRPLVVVLMRGEQRPIRMWEQGARLLDYGFALPESAEPVGELVDGPPSDDEPVPTPPPSSEAPPTLIEPPASGSGAVADSSNEGKTSNEDTIAGQIAVAAAALVVLVGVLWQQLRRTRGDDEADDEAG